MEYSGSYEADDVAAAGPMSEEGSYDRFYEGIGALVSGSTTYEFVLGHIAGGGNWPYAGKPYWVLSSRELPPPEGHEDEVHVVETDVATLAREMDAAANGLGTWVVGGGDVASQFAEAGLLDELHLTVVPVVLGSGKPLFNRPMANSLQLLDTTTFGNGMVELRYAVKR
jgi:dihydrofolate reductase